MAMALADQLREFVALCEAGSTLQAVESFYAEDVVVFENHERARAGRKACLAYEQDALSRTVTPARLRARSTAANELTGMSFIEWIIHFVSDDGRPMRLDEVAVQKWAGGQIVEERFYYEGVVDEGDAADLS
jgi:ketosteroid isomerase-like protein